MHRNRHRRRQMVNPSNFRPSNWTLSSRLSRFIQIRCWPRSWPHPHIPSKSYFSSDGWMTNKNLKDKQLADAVAKQPWDSSVQALAPLPEVVKLLGDNIQWTTDLGNVFLANQSDVMDAVQRMRKKAQDKGALHTTQQQTVDTQVIDNKSVVVIEPANPEVVYVPSYEPAAVYGAPAYPYPPLYYPPGYYAAGAALAFGTGVLMGAWWGGGYGWGCGWGGGNVYVNHFNSFNRNTSPVVE